MEGEKKGEPVIMGITMGIRVVKTDEPLKGYTCYLMCAGPPEGTNDTGDCKNAEPRSLCVGLHFNDVEMMRRFGQMFIDFADKEEAQL